MAGKPLTNLVVISDLHAGCQMALCPPGGVTLDNGGTYRPSAKQRNLWEIWEYVWEEWVPMVTKGEPFGVVVNGDALDGVHHGSVTQITHNIERQRNIAYELLAPIRERATDFYMIRGTEAHVGQSGQDEEELAGKLDARIDEAGKRATHERFIQVGSGLVHCAHHIGTASRAAYETSALAAEISEMFQDSAAWGARPPQVIVRSHRHRHIQISRPCSWGYGIVFTTGAWQLKTPFAHRVAGARVSMPQIGAHLVRQGGQELHARHFVSTVKRPKTSHPMIGGE